MPPASQLTAASEPFDLKSVVLQSEPTNPALLRLKGRVMAAAEHSEIITSYDRMHHRHSRS